MPDIDFLKLPWEIQTALASGYAAYVLAYTGLRDRQRTIDVAFLSLVFSVPATIMFGLLPKWSPFVLIPLAFVVASATAIIWRRFIRPHVFPILRKFDVTWSDDDPSALATLSGGTKFAVTQIAVHLDDGTWLRCDNVNKFDGAPFWPYILGPSGDVALYLTHEEPAGGEARELTTNRDSYYGDLITYIPASRIKQITIRHVSKANYSSRVAAVVVAEPSEAAKGSSGGS
jgi:hypothetical protein